MVVLNELDRFHLALDAVERVPALSAIRGDMRGFIEKKLLQHKAYIKEHGEDLPEIRNWKWPESH